uniref:FYVE-type domain-containing protein n=2 Tax=Plectus sambesii TaxID=2011161 RepID=A0A914W8B3_9BILA
MELQSLELALSSAERPAVESKATLTISDFRAKSNGQPSAATAVPSSTAEDGDGDADSVDSNQEASMVVVASPTEDGVSAVIAVGPTDGGEPDVEITVSPVVDGDGEQLKQTPLGSATNLAKNNEDEAAAKRRKNLRTRFRSSEDLTHRLFVCIAGVADQLQTNYPSDLRKVLKMVLQPNEVVPVFEVSGQTAAVPVNEEETGVEVREPLPLPSFVGVRWVPDRDCDQCTACQAPFTMVRRRHHCRNCGRIFCGRCSANSMQLPELGYERKVRVCNLCFLYKLNPFSPGVQSSASASNGTDSVDGSSDATNSDHPSSHPYHHPNNIHHQNQQHLPMRPAASGVVATAQTDTELPVA